eukprot:15460496-Alexandrium_andersonii.AAC.1
MAVSPLRNNASQPNPVKTHGNSNDTNSDGQGNGEGGRDGDGRWGATRMEGEREGERHTG